MKHEDAPFFQVDQSVVTTSESDVAVPMLFYDASYMLNLFHADEARIVDAIGDVDIEPALDTNGRGLVGLAFYEYRDTSFIPYNEVGLAAQVVRKGDNPPRFPLIDMIRKPTSRKSYNYLFHLPVTTVAANAAGLEIWGFPKFVAEIPLTFEGSRFDGSVLDPVSGSPIFTCTGRRGSGLTLPGIDLRIYSELNGQPMETIVDTNYKGHSGAGGSLTLTVGNSDHAMADTLRKLDLDGKKPFLTHMSDRFRSRLNATKILPERVVVR